MHWKIWHKLLLIAVIAVLPVPLLGYFTIAQTLRDLRAEERRLAGLEYVQGLRELLEPVQRHRTASFAVQLGNEQFRPQLPIIKDQVEDVLARVDENDLGLGTQLEVSEDWQAIKDDWERLLVLQATQKPEETGDLHGQLIMKILQLAARVADSSGMIHVPQAERYYLFDTLTFQLLPQIEILGQAQTAATLAAVQGKVSDLQRSQLQAIDPRLRLLRVAVGRNAEALSRAYPELAEELEAPVVANTVACDDLLLFVNDTLLKRERVDVDPMAIFLTAQKPIDSAFRLFDEYGQSATAATQEQTERTRKQLQVAVGSVTLGALLSLGAVFLVARGILRQVYGITRTFHEVEAGNYTARAPVATADELGEAALSLNQMLDRTLVLIQSREERDRIQASVEKLREEVHGAAGGELTREAQVTPDITGPIAESFNFMIRQLRQLVGRVREAARHVHSATGHIKTMTDQLDHGTATQADQARDVSAAVERLAQSIHFVARTSTIATDVARQSLGQSGKGSQAVQQTTAAPNHVREEVHAMLHRIRQVADRSAELVQVARLVDDIAEWTSILALNAAVHAAVPGEQAQRWAVVAEAAERLALRAGEAARKMPRLTEIAQEVGQVAASLEQMSRQVVDSSLVTGQAAQSLQEINAMAGRQAELIQAITAASKQQGEGSESVSQSVQLIADITHRTAGGVRQAAVLAASLSRLADDLEGSIAAFRLPEPGPDEALASFLHEDGTTDRASVSMAVSATREMDIHGEAHELDGDATSPLKV